MAIRGRGLVGGGLVLAAALVVGGKACGPDQADIDAAAAAAVATASETPTIPAVGAGAPTAGAGAVTPSTVDTTPRTTVVIGGDATGEIPEAADPTVGTIKFGADGVTVTVVQGINGSGKLAAPREGIAYVPFTDQQLAHPTESVDPDDASGLEFKPGVVIDLSILTNPGESNTYATLPLKKVDEIQDEGHADPADVQAAIRRAAKVVVGQSADGRSFTVHGL